jgi:hypothetical protein
LRLRSSLSLPMKLLLGDGRLCLPSTRVSSTEGAVGSPGGYPPAAISSYRLRVEGSGSISSFSESTFRSFSYWARASVRLSERAYSRIRPACASSSAGSSAAALSSASTPASCSARSSWRPASSSSSARYSLLSSSRLPSAHSSYRSPGKSSPAYNSMASLKADGSRLRRAVAAACSKASVCTHSRSPEQSVSRSSRRLR